MIKSNRGYSLIEIGVGILVLTLFLIFSISLFNGCYTNYRRIKARNLAIDRAVYHVENILRQDSDVLTGFYYIDSSRELVPNSIFLNEAYDDFNADRYAKYKGIAEQNVYKPSMNSDDFLDYLRYDKDYYIGKYIAQHAGDSTNTELANGEYCFFKKTNEESNTFEPTSKCEIILDNEGAFELDDANDYIASNNGALRVVKTITRIPVNGETAYGNNVLKVKVDVYYTYEFKRNANIEDMEVLTINTIKLTK